NRTFCLQQKCGLFLQLRITANIAYKLFNV
ncbi:Lipoyl synthase, partial [Haemophilus influenzae]